MSKINYSYSNAMNDKSPQAELFSAKFKTLCGEKEWVPLSVFKKIEHEKKTMQKEAEKWEALYDDVVDRLIHEQNRNNYGELETLAECAERVLTERNKAMKLLIESEPQNRNTVLTAQQDVITELVLENKKLKDDLEKSIKKIENQAERIRYLEGATNHACGTPLSIAIKERNEWKDCATRLHNASGWSDEWPIAVQHYKQLKKQHEKMEARLQ